MYYICYVLHISMEIIISILQSWLKIHNQIQLYYLNYIVLFS